VSLANLELVRAIRRRRDFDMRRVLGASRLAFWRLAVVESLVAAGLGGLAGALLAILGLPLLLSSSSLFANISVAAVLPRVITAAATVALLCAFLLFVVPFTFLRGSGDQARLNRALRWSPGSLRFSQVQAALLVVQIALALPLVTGMSDLIRSVAAFQRLGLGFDHENTVAAQVSFPDHAAEAAWASWIADRLDRLATVPGVLEAGAGSDLLHIGSAIKTTISPRDRPVAEGEASFFVDQRSVTPRFFEALGVNLLKGRTFTASDLRSAPKVAVINRAMADRFWADQNPLGRRFRLGSPQELALYGQHVEWRIVGVVEDVKRLDLAASSSPEIYLPFAQMPSAAITFVLHTPGGKSPPLAEIKEILAPTGSGTRLGRVQPIRELVADLVGRPKLQVFFLASFALVSVALLAISTYALMAHAVEAGAFGLGICLALGASRHDLLRLILAQAAVLGAIGLAVGSVLAVIASRGLRLGIALPLVGPGLVVFSAAALGIATLIGVASWLPAHRVVVRPIQELLRTDS
jgi:putative ABC transport system permease protein